MNILNIYFAIIFLSIVFLLPAFRMGIFWDSEIINIVSLVATGIMVFVARQLYLSGLSRRYLVLAIIGLIPLSYNPELYKAFMGIIQTNLGILGFIGLAAMTMLIKKVEKTHYYFCFFTILVITAWNLLSHPYYFEFFYDAHPFHFTSFVGGISLFPLAYIIHNRNLKFRNLQLALVIVAILLSCNKSIIALLPLLLLIPHARQIIISKMIAKYLVILIPFLILGFNYLSFLKVGIDETGSLYSSASRHISQRVVFEAYKTDPSKILTGFGLGTTTDKIQEHLNVLPIQLYKDNHKDPNWDGLRRLEFHTYNAISEIFLQLGILGVIALLYVWIWPIQNSRNQDISVNLILMLLWATNQSNWFITPYQWIFDILFFKTIAQDSLRIYPEDKILKLSNIALFRKCIAGLLVLGGFFQLSILALTSPRHSPLAKLISRRTDTSISGIFRFQGTPHFVELIRDLNLGGENSKNQIELFLDLVEKNKFSTLEAVHINESFGLIAQGTDVLLKDRIFDVWSKFLIEVAKSNPNRFDFCHPFLITLVKEKNHVHLQQFIQEMIVIAPSNPIVRWFFNKEFKTNFEVDENIIKKWLPWV